MLEARGETGAALALLMSVWDQTSTIHGLLQYRNLAPDLVRLALLHGDAERAAAVAMETEQLAARSGAPSARAVALRCRGLVDDNADLLVEAVAEYRRSPRRTELAGACEETANTLFRIGRADEAVSLLDEAAAIYLEAGADEYVSRVDSVLRAHGTRRRRRGPARALRGWEALSHSELKIAEFVAEGLSNPQIAARLYISRRTVETHLSHVFAKLDISSRAQIAAASSRQQTQPRSDSTSVAGERGPQLR